MTYNMLCTYSFIIQFKFFQGSQFGIAHGAIISDQVNEDIKKQLAQQGYNVFQTMSSPNAMYISCPTLPWLSYFGIWLILSIVYPRFYKYSKVSLTNYLNFRVEKKIMFIYIRVDSL